MRTTPTTGPWFARVMADESIDIDTASELAELPPRSVIFSGGFIYQLFQETDGSLHWYSAFPDAPVAVEVPCLLLERGK